MKNSKSKREKFPSIDNGSQKSSCLVFFSDCYKKSISEEAILSLHNKDFSAVRVREGGGPEK